jgi:tetratricopeptide (TPR) repeat protein
LEAKENVKGPAVQLKATKNGPAFLWWLANRNWILSLLLVVTTVLVYLPVRHYPFVNYDDPDYVAQNPAVRAGLTWRGVEWAFTTMHASNWHPFTWLSFMLDCQLFGLNAGGDHFVNVLFHAANTVLLFVLLLRLTGACWPSVFIAALFAWHPLHVESVAWIAERKDVLSAFFGLLALLAYAGYAQRRSKTAGQGPREEIAVPALGARLSIFNYFLVLFFFACGLMAKPMLVTLPFVFLLLDYWPLRRASHFELRFSHWFSLVLEKWPFFVMAAASCIVTFVAQKRGQTIAPLEEYPLSFRISNTALAYAEYLFKSVYPVNLTVIYPLHEIISWGKVAGTIVVLVVISGLVWWARRRHPYLLTGWLWYLGMLVPVIGLVQVGPQAMADRYTYLPLVGVFMGIAFGMGDLAKKLRLAPGLMVSFAGMVLGGCLLMTARQLQYWQNSETLFEHALAVTTGNSIAQGNLGVALSEADRLQAALEHFREAVRIKPKDPLAHNNLGVALATTGHLQEAMEQFREALRLAPNYIKAHNNLGNALLRAGHPQAAIEQFQDSLRIEPDDASAHNNLAVALAQIGRVPEAIQQYQAALRLQPDFTKAYYDLGLALLRTGQVREAIAEFRTALRLQPDFTAASDQLGDALIHWSQELFKKGQMSEAIAPLEEGLQIHPDNAGAYNCLGDIFLRQGLAGDAVADFQKALALQPDNVEAQNKLAWVWASAPDATLRNGARAVAMAQQANQLSSGQNPAVLGTLAAAYAEVGHFPQAIATAQKALQLAVSQTNAAWLVNRLQTQIKFYQAGSPFRDDSLTNPQAITP